MQLPSHYRLEQLQEEFNFATDQELEESKRFKMISLREKEEPHFLNKQVPALDKEIPDEVFLVRMLEEWYCMWRDQSFMMSPISQYPTVSLVIKIVMQL